LGPSRNGNCSPPAIGYRFAAIDHQIHEQLLHLSCVRFYRRKIFRQIQTQLHTAGNRGLNERDRFSHVCGEINTLQNELASARICEHLLRERGRFLTRCKDFLHGHSSWRIRGEQIQRKAGVTDNADQQVVKIVRDTARQDT
jgi:hypothetical protein